MSRAFCIQSHKWIYIEAYGVGNEGEELLSWGDHMKLRAVTSWQEKVLSVQKAWELGWIIYCDLAHLRHSRLEDIIAFTFSLY